MEEETRRERGKGKTRRKRGEVEFTWIKKKRGEERQAKRRDDEERKREEGKLGCGGKGTSRKNKVKTR